MTKLTPQQECAVNSNAKKILVLSCAGSGKTMVIINRMMRLKQMGVQPENILALTFSNKAAQEMKNRICKEDYSFGVKLNIKTFHSFGLEIIRQYASMLGFAQPIKIAKTGDVQNILKEVFGNRHEQQIEGSELNDYIRKSKGFEAYVSIPFYDAIVKEYNKILSERCMVDMDDMIFIPVNLLTLNASVRKVLTDKYKYLFVDEYQDTNEAQNRLLNLIIGEDTNVCLVGDDDQAIYEWRGAKPDYIRQKARSSEYECIKLEKNFRSQASVIAIANRIINHNNNRVTKKIDPFRDNGVKPIFQRFFSQKEESEWVATEVQELIASERFNPADIAVLYRNSEQADYLKKAFSAHGIEYENAEVDDNARYSAFINVLQAILYLSSTSDLDKALNFPTRCFDKFRFIDAKNAYCDLYGQNCNYTTAEWIDKLYLADLEFDGCEDFRERYSIITQLHEAKNWTSTQVIAFYLSYMKRKGYDKTESTKYSYVLQVFDIAKNYEEVFVDKTLKDFLYHLSLSYELNDINSSVNIDAVNLMTMHRSKGLEFKVVFIVGVQVGCMPNDYFIHSMADLEAERRLFYVAITRAKELLYLSAFKDPIGGSTTSKIVTHGFMAELPDIVFGTPPTKETLEKEFPPKESVENAKVTPEDAQMVVQNTTSHINDESVNVDDDNSSYNTEGNLFELTEQQVEQYFKECIALSKNIDVPKNCFIVIIGSMDVKLSVAKAILKANSFSDKQVEIYDYDGKGFNINRYLFNYRCIGIIMGPEAHKIPEVDAKSLKSKLIAEQGYPYSVDLINKHITKKTLQEAIVKIKWNYTKNKQELKEVD